MSSKAKVMFALVVVLALGTLVLPYLARRINSKLSQEAQYLDMIAAFPIAAEMAPSHPTAQRWEMRKAALLKSGYIETRQLRMQNSLAAKGAVMGFFAAFHTRFPGVECIVRDIKSDKPLVVVTARKVDLGPLGAIERFVTKYDADK